MLTALSMFVHMITQYGYILPEEDENTTYAMVYFGQGKLFMYLVYTHPLEIAIDKVCLFRICSYPLVCILDCTPSAVPLRNSDADDVVAEFLSDLQSCVPALLGCDLHLSAVAVCKQLGLVSATRAFSENGQPLTQLQLPDDIAMGRAIREEERVVAVKPGPSALHQPSNAKHNRTVCPKDVSDARTARVEHQRLLTTQTGFLSPNLSSSTSTTSGTSITSPTARSHNAMIGYPPKVVSMTAMNEARKTTTIQSLDELEQRVRTVSVNEVGTHNSMIYAVS